MNNFRIEIRYAVLSGLLMLLWLATGFMIGLQDEPLIIYHNYLTLFILLILLFVCIRLAIRDKAETLNGKLNFKEAFITGFLLSFFAAVLSVPCQIIFHKLINPDFFDTMISTLIHRATDANKARAEAEMYINLTSHIVQSGLETLVIGTLITAALAWRINTKE